MELFLNAGLIVSAPQTEQTFVCRACWKNQSTIQQYEELQHTDLSTSVVTGNQLHDFLTHTHREGGGVVTHSFTVAAI